MSRFYKTIIILTAVALGIVIYKWIFDKPVWMTILSPNKTYKIEMTGDKSRGGFIIPSVVGYSVYEADEIIAGNSAVHTGDWQDISFEIAYPKHEWISENVLRFWRNPHISKEKDKLDVLLISNDSDKTIKYLEVKVRDMFLIFDLQPKSVFKLSSIHQSWNYSLKVRGKFEDGEKIEYEMNFVHEDKLYKPLLHCLSVNYSRVIMERPLDTYENIEDFDTLKITNSATCNP